MVRRAMHGATRVASRSHAVDAALRAVDRNVPRPKHVLPVLMYHRVDEARDAPPYDPVLLSATPDAFDEQMALLATEYEPLSADALLAVAAGRQPLPPRAVVVTFDDGYVDFAEHAWPALRRHGVPVTLFVPTAFPDGAPDGFWWDRLYRAFTATTRTDTLVTPVGTFALATANDRYDSCRALAERIKGVPHRDAMAIVDTVTDALGAAPAPRSVLGWDDLRALAAEGVAVAPHSRTHPMLDQLPAGELDGEIGGSRNDIEQAIGACPPVFCYPAGQNSPAVVDAVRAAGFDVAFTTDVGVNDVRDGDWLTLRRINVSPRVTPTVMRALLNPWSARLLRFVS
jgi:peptidoglycan/xylan/chitin deacetylase (PgdA/CDA1 family)